MSDSTPAAELEDHPTPDAESSTPASSTSAPPASPAQPEASPSPEEESETPASALAPAPASAPASDSESEPTEDQPLLERSVDETPTSPFDSSTVPLLGDASPEDDDDEGTTSPTKDFVEISPLIRSEEDQKPIVAAPPQTQLSPREAEPEEAKTEEPQEPGSPIQETREDTPPRISAQDDTPASSPPDKADTPDTPDTPSTPSPPSTPATSTPKGKVDPFAAIDLSIEEEPSTLPDQADDSSTPPSASEAARKKKLESLKRNLKTGTESLKRGSESVGNTLKRGSESVGNTLKRQSSQVGASLKRGGSQVGESLKRGSSIAGASLKRGGEQVGSSLKRGSEQVGTSLKKGGEQVGSTLRRGTIQLRDNLKPEVEAAKVKLAKAKPKPEKNEHYCNCLRGIMLMSIDDLKSPLFWRAAMAEFVGTMILTMVGCGSCVGYADQMDLVRISLGFGLIVATVIWGVGHVSGGHVNPAVSLAMAATRKISVARALLYIVMQLCGAVIGAGILKGLTPDGLNSPLGATSLAKGAKHVGNVSTEYHINAGQGFGIEFFITFILVFTVFASCDNKRSDHNGSSPLAIGLAVVVCHLWAVPATGASMNTARSFGPAVVAGIWEDHWVYWVGPLLGGVAAGFIYDHFFAANSSKQKFRTCMLGAEYEGEDFEAVDEKPKQIMESEDDIVETKSEV